MNQYVIYHKDDIFLDNGFHVSGIDKADAIEKAEAAYGEPGCWVAYTAAEVEAIWNA